MKKALLLMTAIVMGNYASYAETTEPTTPTFPESFTVTTTPEGLTVEQGVDQGVYTIKVSGMCDADEVTVTLATPDGWDGFMGAVEGEGSGASPLNVKSRAEDDEEDENWMSKEYAGMSGLAETSSLVFPLSLEKNDNAFQLGRYYLIAGANVYMGEQIAVEVEVYKTPTFPEEIAVAATNGVEIETDNSQGMLSITFGGMCDEDEVSLTLTVPEGWTGYVGMTDADGVPEVGGQNVKSRAQDSEWKSLADVLKGDKGSPALRIIEGNTIKFPADGECHMGMVNLYVGDQVDIANGIYISTEGVTTGIENVSVEAGEARYYNILGTEVANPKAGVFVKVVNGKASKVFMK